jgi:hypothetical protein
MTTFNKCAAMLNPLIKGSSIILHSLANLPVPDYHSVSTTDPVRLAAFGSPLLPNITPFVMNAYSTGPALLQILITYSILVDTHYVDGNLVTVSPHARALQYSPRNFSLPPTQAEFTDLFFSRFHPSPLVAL